MKYKKFFQIMKPALVENKVATSYKVIGIIVSWLVALVLPFVSGLLVDRLVGDATLDIILSFALVFLAIYVVRTINIFLRSFSDVIVNSLLDHKTGTNPILHILKSRFSTNQNRDAGELVERLRSDGMTFAYFFSNFTSVCIEIITVVSALILLFVVDPFIGILTLTVMPLYFLIYMAFRKKVYARNKESRRLLDVYQARRNEQIYRMAFIRRHEISNESTKRMEEAFQTSIKAAMRAQFMRYFFANAGAFTSALFHVSLVAFGGYRVISGYLSIGMFTMTTMYFSMIMDAMSEFFNFGANYQMGTVSAERLDEIYANPIDQNGEKKPERIGDLKLSGLSLSYGENQVFNNVSHAFQAGKVYAICGENGSGKSSLLNCILGLYPDICKGEISFDGSPMNEIDMAYMRRNQIAFVEQMPEFLSMSINEFLDFGIEQTEHTKRRKQELIEAFGLGKFDFDETITESGSNFSGGEKQKIAITRALSKDCSIAILDEPTSALDTDSVEVLVDILNRQKSDRITLVISHDSRILDLCDEHWYIDRI